MLILSRAVGEFISIGEHITLRVLEVNGRQVKLGVQAPRGVKVYREEIYQRILERQGRYAAPESVPNP